MLHPVGGLRDHFEAAIITQIYAGLGHLVAQELILFSPNKQGGGFDAAAGQAFGWAAEDSPVPVDHSSPRAGLAPGGAVGV